MDNEMKKKEYVVPETKVYLMQPKVPGSTEEEWEGEEDVNSGEFDI